MTTPDSLPPVPTGKQVNEFHKNSDIDSSDRAGHHSLGANDNQAASGAHTHDGRNSKQISLADIAKTPIGVSGSRGGNTALANLISALASQGLITDNTTV